MEQQRPAIRTETGNGAPSKVVQLHGVPVPSRVLGFSLGWHRAEPVESDPVSLGARPFTLLTGDAGGGSDDGSGRRHVQEVAAA